MDIKGLVFSIEEFSTFDGPGIRSTVFLKGCPLKCSWCHNPEGQSFSRQILKNVNSCVKCGKCEEKAEELTGKKELVEECVKVCPMNLIRVSGDEYTPSELYEKITKNIRFFESTGGGVTFSGGEPLAQPEFLSECLELFEGKVHRCIQTSGFCKPEIFSDIVKNTDLFLFDLKVMDAELSKRYIGTENSKILKNFETLVKSGTDFIVRLPLIPEVTATEDNMKKIAEFLKEYNVTYAEALPYNKMAGGKYALSGREFKPDYNPEAELFIPDKLFGKYNIELKVL